MLQFVAAVSRFLPNSVKLFIYQVPFLSGFIRKTLNYSAPKGLTEITVTGGLLQGTRLILDLQSEKYYWLGTYELPLQQAIIDFVRPGMTVYDVGANIGYTSLLFAQAVGVTGHVFSFEPLPANTARFKSNMMLNPLLEEITTLKSVAVSDRNGTDIFMIDKSHGRGRLNKSTQSPEKSYIGDIEVKILNLDSFLHAGNPAPNLIKIDIEGGGDIAIIGMQRLLEQTQPILFIELHTYNERKAIWEALQRHEYSILRMGTDYPKVSEITDLARKEYIVAIPKGEKI